MADKSKVHDCMLEVKLDDFASEVDIQKLIEKCFEPSGYDDGSYELSASEGDEAKSYDDFVMKYMKLLLEKKIIIKKLFIDIINPKSNIALLSITADEHNMAQFVERLHGVIKIKDGEYVA